VMVQRGHAHARDFGEFLKVQRFRVIGSEPSDGLRRSLTLVAQRRYCTQTRLPCKV
jgi:hypothetical protein